jgi:hypothetical protein
MRLRLWIQTYSSLFIDHRVGRKQRSVIFYIIKELQN